MPNVRTINSPGVEVREIDISTRAVTPVGTNVLVTGYAPQGPTYEIVNVSTLSEFETVYGTPTNAAERYFYYSVRQLFTNGNNPNIQVARLPYGAGTGEGFTSYYSALVYPVLPIPALADITTYAVNTVLTTGMPLSAAQGYYFGEPALVSLTPDQYNSISQGGITWQQIAGGSTTGSFSTSGSLTQLASAGMIVLNEAKTTINEKFEGIYVNFSDSFNTNPATNYDNVISIKTAGASYFNNTVPTYTTVPSNRIGFNLSATNTAGVDSMSEDIENVPTFNIGASGYDDVSVLSVWKVRPNPFSPTVTTLQYVLQEGYTGSLYSQRQIQDPLGGSPLSFYLRTVANENSNNIQVFINPYISSYANWLDANGNASKKVRIFRTDSWISASAAVDAFNTVAAPYLSGATFGGGSRATYIPANNLYGFGVYADTLATNGGKVIGDTATKLNYVLNLAENADLNELDLTVDAGLSTIYATTTTLGASSYSDSTLTDAFTSQINALSASDGNPVSNTLTSSWNSITSLFESFARTRRKDHVYISDPLRQIFVRGSDFKTLGDITKNFSQNIYWPLRNLYGAYNSSYATTYANWAKISDIFTSQSVWLPFSGFAAAMITNTDATEFPWIAPAGYTKGIINGLNDIGINPQQKHRDLLYKVSLNPVIFSPNDGYIVMGQKTLLKAPSAFDRLNVRRLFLFLEKATLKTMKYFVFQPNTTFTRGRAVNTLAPIFELAKNTQGLYDYLLVCNESNNTGSVIDDNTMVIDIYIKPVRSSEYILINFYASKTSQSFDELLQG